MVVEVGRLEEFDWAWRGGRSSVGKVWWGSEGKKVGAVGGV